MIALLMLFGILFGIGSLAIYFYKRLVLVARINSAIDRVRSFDYSPEVLELLRDINKELRK